MLSSISVKYHS